MTTPTYSTLATYRSDAVKCHLNPATDKQLGLICHLVDEKQADIKSLPFAEKNHNGQIYLCLSKRAAMVIIDHLQNMDAAGEVLCWELSAETRDSIEHYNTDGYECRSDALAARAAAMTGTAFRANVSARDASQKLDQIVATVRTKLDEGGYDDVGEFSSLDEAFAVMRVTLTSGEHTVSRDIMITSYRKAA